MTATDERVAASALAAVLDPSSVAIIGASQDPERIGGRPIFYLRRAGFSGQIYPVNPHRETVQGLPCFPDVASLPCAPDVALVAVGGDAAVSAVQACAQRGVRVAIVLASGFREVGAAGAALERRMVSEARDAGMRLIGPNCYGSANFATGAVLTFSTALRDRMPRPGPVAIVSQSGSMSAAPIALLARRGIGVRGIYGTGNDADVTAAELATEVARDPGVELLLLFIESVGDAEPLAELARVARDRNLQVVALKLGSTPAGQAAARSHTGALANEDRVVDAFLAKHGIWRAQDLDEVLRTAPLHLAGWSPTGRRTAVISSGGGSCVQAADAAYASGVPLSELSAQTRAALDDVLPDIATTTNPIDLTGALLGNGELFSRVLPLVGGDDATDIVLVSFPVGGTGFDVPRFASDTAALRATTGKPVLAAIAQDEVAAPFEAAGVPRFATDSEALSALSRTLQAFERRRAARTRDPRPLSPRPTSPSELLDEAASLELLARHGLAAVPHRLCRDPDEAVSAFQELGPVVAVKGCSTRTPHKSDLGLVHLHLGTERAVHEATEQVLERLAAVDPDARGVLVASMVTGIEFIVGAHIDPVFGPVVLVGAGGKYVDVLPDVQVLVPPLDLLEVRDAISRLRLAPLLAGVRGEPPADTGALEHAVLAVAELVAARDERVVSLDLNPIFVRPAGAGCLVADALVERLAAVRQPTPIAIQH